MNQTKSFNVGHSKGMRTEKVCARPPIPQVACVHQIHAAGGVGGFTTMAMVFVLLLLDTSY
jgi:hypothetical protein